MGQAKRRKQLDPNYGKPKPNNRCEELYQAVLSMIRAQQLNIDLAHKCIVKGQVLAFIPLGFGSDIGYFVNLDIQDLRQETPALYAMCLERLKADTLTVIFPINNDQNTVVLNYEKDLIPPRI